MSRIAGLQRSLSPSIEKARLLVFAADHGITKAMPSVSAFPREVGFNTIGSTNFVEATKLARNTGPVCCRRHL